MSAASVLSSFTPSAMPGPVMPMDVGFYFSSSPPIRKGFLGSYEELQKTKQQVGRCRSKHQQLYEPLRPCLSSQRAGNGGRAPQRCVGWPGSGGTAKKKVVFADSKGMSLTAIHVFSKFDDEALRSRSEDELQFDMNNLEAATVNLKISSGRSLLLNFQQPSADYLDFRNRLLHNSVCLENCSLQERSLTGTVKVRNIGFEKSVRLRATFDSWASSTEVDCSFLNNVYGCQDTDTFAFVLELPNFIPPQHRVEFCICYQVHDQTFWDNNDGKNYTLKHTGWNGEELNVLEEKKNHEHTGLKLLQMEFDQFGSPRTSSGQFPGWQSWGHMENTVVFW